MFDFASPDATPQATTAVGGPLATVWRRLLSPLLVGLDAHLDRRLVATFAQAVRAIVEHRHRAHGLLLSELGAYLWSPEHAPAGTKRLSNLLRSDKWSAHEIATYLWQQAVLQVERWEQDSAAPDSAAQDSAAQDSGQAPWHNAPGQPPEPVLALWDDSVLEKPESTAAQGLCAVRSSKAARLSRIKPGYYRPPGAPVFVPGLHWLAVLFIRRSGPPWVAAMKWWSTRSLAAGTAAAGAETAGGAAPEPWLQERSQLRRTLLEQCQQELGRRLLHIFDRGFAGAPWLGELHRTQSRFVLRWPKGYKLRTKPVAHAGHPDPQEVQELKAWQHLRGRRSWDHQLLPDAKQRQLRKMGVVAVPVFHAAYGAGQEPLWLVASRRAQGSQAREPWYLLTNEPVADAAAAWRVVQAYARRWQIEMSLRFNKSELALESPRLWSWQRRLKLLMMVTLAYAFLLALLRLPPAWRQSLLRHWCHRTGKRSRATPTPLYRLRLALANLFRAHPPLFTLYQTPG